MRCALVTGVHTCALPIYAPEIGGSNRRRSRSESRLQILDRLRLAIVSERAARNSETELLPSAPKKSDNPARCCPLSPASLVSRKVREECMPDHLRRGTRAEGSKTLKKGTNGRESDRENVWQHW